MEKNEVITRLKGHMAYCIRHHGKVNHRDKEYCIRYIRDFLFVKRKEAEKFYEQNLM